MSANERANMLIKDILVNHLPRIKEGLEKGYVDENQILIVYDHALRARILQDCDFEVKAPKISAGISQDTHDDALSRINAELEAEICPGCFRRVANCACAPRPESGEKEQNVLAMHGQKPVNDKPADDKIYNFKLNSTPRFVFKPVMTGSELRALLPDDKSTHSIFQEATGNDPDINIGDSDSVEIADKKFYSVPPATFGNDDPVTRRYTTVGSPKKVGNVPVPSRLRGEREHATMLDEANFHRGHVENLECVCGGLIHDLPTSVETMLKCSACGRTFLDESALARAKRDQRMKGEKMPDATYWTTGTLLPGNRCVPMETEINLNGRKAIVRGVDGKFTLTYAQIVRMTISQQRGHLNDFNVSDADLPVLSCVYTHRVVFSALPGERSGTLRRGQKVECTPGMSITCMDTSNA